MCFFIKIYLDKTQNAANGERRSKKNTTRTEAEFITRWDLGGAKTNQLVMGNKGRPLYSMVFNL